jgi:hypothetical protein
LHEHGDRGVTVNLLGGGALQGNTCKRVVWELVAVALLVVVAVGGGERLDARSSSYTGRQRAENREQRAEHRREQRGESREHRDTPPMLLGIVIS